MTHNEVLSSIKAGIAANGTTTVLNVAIAEVPEWGKILSGLSMYGYSVRQIEDGVTISTPAIRVGRDPLENY
jgi:hypothetical protein